MTYLKTYFSNGKLEFSGLYKEGFEFNIIKIKRYHRRVMDVHSMKTEQEFKKALDEILKHYKGLIKFEVKSEVKNLTYYKDKLALDADMHVHDSDFGDFVSDRFAEED